LCIQGKNVATWLELAFIVEGDNGLNVITCQNVSTIWAQ